MAASRFDRQPKYELLIAELKADLTRGEYRPGDRLPSHEELCEKYGLSYMTVREAVGALVHEGLLHRIQGKGTFVSEKKQDYRTIGLVIPHLYVDYRQPNMGYDMGFLLPIVNAIEGESQKHNARVLLCLDSPGDAAEDRVTAERRNIRDLLSRGVDGIVIFYIGGDSNTEDLAAVQQAGVPLVLIERYSDGIDTDYVVSDNYAGAYRATRAMLDAGHGPVYYLDSTEACSTNRDRLKGCTTAMKEHGWDCDNLIRTIPPPSELATHVEAAYQATKKILAEVGPSFSVFSANALAMSGVWRGMEAGGVVHSRFVLACFDEPSIYTPGDVKLVKVLQPLDEMGRTAVRMVVDRLEGKPGVHHEVLEPSQQTVGLGVGGTVSEALPL